MANFSSLKQAIQNYIKENGNKEITGNLLQEILLSMVVTMGDNAINGVLQSLSNEMISRENADGLLNQALTAEQQRAIAAETKSAVLDGETKTLVFKNAAGQELYHVSVASLIANGLVDVEVDGTNLVMTFHTESGDEEITISIGDIFNPSNYYTKTQVDGLLLPITTAITNVSSRLNEGYIYLGVADPETIPTSATGKFFYIATQAGTYHFMTNGDIPIVISSNGLYILSGGAEADDWLLETIVTFTSNVQFNNAQLITSGGVFNALLPINDLLRRNYMLAGVADTTTIPTEDTNVFYLAGQGGTYTHFLNGDEEPLVLSKGLTVIYRGVDDDGWNYWVIYTDNDFINTNRAQALTSDQQTEAQNNLQGKSYEPAQFSGLGKKVLSKNIQQVGGVSKNVMTQAFFQDEQGNALTNTVFVIQYDFTLGENVTIPANCILEFEGGSISGDSTGKDTITGNNTKIIAQNIAIFNSGIVIAGTWNCPRVTSKWFSDITNQNRVQQLINLTDDNINNIVYVENATYNVTIDVAFGVAISLKSNTEFVLNGTILLASNDFQGYYIIYVNNKENINIHGKGTIIGDLDSHIDTGGQWGHGIMITNSKNCSISGINVKKCWGDCLCLDESNDIINSNLILEFAKRNGISVIGCSNIKIKNSVINEVYDAYPTIQLPNAAIDLEPNEGGSINDNIIIENIIANNCSSLIVAYFVNFAYNKNIYINNVRGTNLRSRIFSFENAENIFANNIMADGVLYVDACKNIKISNYVGKIISINACGHEENTVELSNFNIENGNTAYLDITCSGMILRDSKFMCSIPIRFIQDTNHADVNIISNCKFELVEGVTKEYFVSFNVNDVNALFENNIINVLGSSGSGLFKQISTKGRFVNTTIKGNFTWVKSTTGGEINILPLPNCGTTRPSLSSYQDSIGFVFFDTTLGKPIYWNGTEWVDATGAPV